MVAVLRWSLMRWRFLRTLTKPRRAPGARPGSLAEWRNWEPPRLGLLRQREKESSLREALQPSLSAELQSLTPGRPGRSE